MKNRTKSKKFLALLQTTTLALGVFSMLPNAVLAETDYGDCTVRNGVGPSVYSAGFFEWHSFPTSCPSGQPLSSGSHNYKGDATKGLVFCSEGNFSVSSTTYTQNYKGCTCYQVPCSNGMTITISGSGSVKASSSSIANSSSDIADKPNYVDFWDEYVTDAMLVGGEKSTTESLAKKLKAEGWIFIDSDLNARAGGDYVYLLIKKDSRANPENGYITDFIIRTENKSEIMYGGRIYYRVPHDGDDHFKKFGGNLNSNTKKNSTNMWLYSTKENFEDKRVVSGVFFNSKNNDIVSDIDLNEGAGGDYIYMHLNTLVKTNRPSSDPQLATGLTYNGKSQQLIKTPAVLDNGTMYYSLDSLGAFLSDPSSIVGKNVGTYTVFYYAGRTRNCEKSPIKSQSVAINE